MKHILIFFALLFASASYGQIQDWNIKIRSAQDQDSTYVMLSDTAGQFAGRGRWYSLAILADLIEGYLSVGGISDGDKGDITVSGSGATWNIDANTIGATEIAVTGVTAGTYNYPGSIKVDADGRIELISSLGDPPLTSEVDGDITNEGSLTVEAGGATTSEIHSNTSGSTDVTLNAAWGLDISENTGTGNITYIADSSQVATQYDLTQITGTADHDFYETATTTPPNAITDKQFHTGDEALGADSFIGKLSINNDGNDTIGLTIKGYFDGLPAIGIYQSASNGGWEVELSDVNDMSFNSIISGTVTSPLVIDAGSPNASVYIQSDGDVQISDYPNSRDDGTPTNVLGTDINGVIQSYPVADVQPTTEAIQDIVGAMFTGNTETNVTVDYQDADGTIDVVVTGGSPKYKTGITVDGGGEVITSGTKGRTQIETSGTITGVTVLADVSGSVTFDIKKCTFSGFPGSLATIVGSNAPALSSAQKIEVTLDGGWTTSVTAGDVLEFSITGTPTTITQATLIIFIQP